MRLGKKVHKESTWWEGKGYSGQISPKVQKTEEQENLDVESGFVPAEKGI